MHYSPYETSLFIAMLDQAPIRVNGFTPARDWIRIMAVVLKLEVKKDGLGELIATVEDNKGCVLVVEIADG